MFKSSWWGTSASSSPSQASAVQDGAGSAVGDYAQIPEVLDFADYVLDTAEGGRGVLVDGGLHVGGSGLCRARSPLLPPAAGSTSQSCGPSASCNGKNCGPSDYWGGCPISVCSP